MTALDLHQDDEGERAEAHGDRGEGEIEVTLVLKTRQPLPTVEDVCKCPPSRPQDRFRDKSLAPGHIDYESFNAMHGAHQDALEAVAAFATQRGLAVVEGDGRLQDGKLTGAVELRATVTLKGPPIAFEGVEQALAGHVTFIFTPERAGPLSPTRAVMFLPATKADGINQDYYSAQQVTRIYRYPGWEHPQPPPGEGECLGLVEMAGAFLDTDIEEYFKKYAPRPQILRYAETGPGSNELPQEVFDMEVTMDVELAGAACPGAKLVVYSQHTQDPSLHVLFRLLTAAVFDTENKPSVLAVMWSAPEGTPGGIGEAEEAPFNELFVKAALLGITICAPSGDYGTMNPSTDGRLLSLRSFPASSPLVVACGGTALVADGDELVDESVWNQIAQTWFLMGANNEMIYCGIGGASGGGVSSLNAMPAYQEGFGVPKSVTIRSQCMEIQSVVRCAGRGMPDIAASSDLLAGYDVFFRGRWGTGGATSAATPVLAALFVRLNQALGRRLGFVNPLLYELQKQRRNLFRLTTRGSNGGYEARQEGLWNPCTGLGSPIGTNILAALREQFGG